MTDFDWRNQAIYLAPGSLIVVGPMGWFKLSAPNEHEIGVLKGYL